jgi:glycosyltransferase involved in cell wall biosynthesis
MLESPRTPSRPSPSDETHRRDIVFVSLENWDDIWRRNQFVCDELARRDPHRRILFVGLPRNVSHALRHGHFREAASGGKPVSASRPNIIIASPTKLLPNTITAGRWLNEAGFRRHVLQMMDRFDFYEPLLWINDHSAVHMVGRMGEAAVVYDITDDWTTLTQSSRLTQLIARQDQELCRRADAVIVCSERLREMKTGMARQLHLIPNGVNAAHYSTVQRLPEQASRWKHPVVGYVGTIHPDRIDVSLVEGVAREMPEASIVLVGPNHLRAAEMDRLGSLANVFFTGPVPYSDVPAHMNVFDICMTPHRMTPFTESLNPIKLWEYLAVGKPIVSTNVAGFRDYPQWVSIASTAGEFTEAIRRGLVEIPEIAPARRAEAARHSWSARVDEIERVLALCEPRGKSEAAHV